MKRFSDRDFFRNHCVDWRFAGVCGMLLHQLITFGGDLADVCGCLGDLVGYGLAVESLAMRFFRV